MWVVVCVIGADTTLWQQQLLVQVERDASDQAIRSRPSLLARLAAPDIRATLKKCCPAVASLSPAGLLTRLRTEISASEVVSAFSARDPGTQDAMPFWFGPSLHEAENSTGFDNLWSVWLKEGQNFSGSFFSRPLDDVETNYYGLKPFRQRGQPSTTAETRERGVYALVNLLRFEGGSPLYGDVSLVLSPSTAARTSILSAFDSGSWNNFCNATGAAFPHPYPHNCSAYDGHSGLGTLNQTDHLLLANERYWKTPRALLSKIERVFAPSAAPPPLEGSDLVHYLEAVPAAQLLYPTDGISRSELAIRLLA